MSVFDYPRLNFSGKSVIDVATGNNCFFLPLVLFDPLAVEVVMPPRLYVNKDVLVKGHNLRSVKDILPEGCSFKRDRRGLYSGISYVELDCISNEEDFETWMHSPLGSCHLDKEYWPLYDCVCGEKKGAPLTGSIPGYWNFYGTMKFWFDNVTVRSADILTESGQRQTVTAGDSESTSEIDSLLGSQVVLDITNPDGHRFHSAVMIDTEPTFSVMTQVFCDTIEMFKGDQTHFKGSPLNAPFRFLNPFKITNENVPLNSSCVFTTSIALDQLENGEDSDIIRFIRNHESSRGRKLKGIYVSYSLFEVAENRPGIYDTKGKVPNPATSTVAGHVSPWYEEDILSTHFMSRQLNAVMPYAMREGLMPPVGMIPPVGFQVNYERQVIIIDFLNGIPEVNASLTKPGEVPRTDEEYKYETHDLGEVVLGVTTKDGREHAIDTFKVDEASLPRQHLFDTGGVIEFSYASSGIANDDLRDGLLWLKGDAVNPGTGKQMPNAYLMQESEIMIGTDQAAVYVDQYDDPGRGCRMFSARKEPCVLRILRRGVPVEEPIEITVVRYAYRLWKDTSCEITIMGTDSYKDGDTFSFSTDEPGGVVYHFIPGRHDYVDTKTVFDVLGTSFYMVARILARKDYGKYFDPKHPDYQEVVTWDDLRKEIFATYEMIYPVMKNMKLPFTEEIWANPFMAKTLVEAVSFDKWRSAWYMPFTRELSGQQVELIKKWAKPYLEEETIEESDVFHFPSYRHGRRGHFPLLDQMH